MLPTELQTTRLRAKALTRIEKLRNPIAHSRTIASDLNGLRKAVRVILLVRDLIEPVELRDAEGYRRRLESYLEQAHA